MRGASSLRLMRGAEEQEQLFVLQVVLKALYSFPALEMT
jgi:hypothetical protein